MKNTINNYTPGGFLKTMSILHMGIAAAPVVLGAFFYFKTGDAALNFSNSSDIFLAIVPVVALASIFLGDLIFKKNLKSLPENATLKNKLAKFQTASIIKYGLMEGGALFCIVVFANSQNLTYLIIGVFLICYLFLQRPTKQKIERALNLKGADKAKFDRTNDPLD
ncbi:hypothetical protein Murru_2003 [Allomuricauda ruestringensis DSM 13258]|uniref:Uncharacterized protein n=1 Tax=Allomuricauda ruestringensis (strain DSM 13258 / CIP 107369 / LMG 19739 / B1) TaxID=886377 RepID=G2PL13_ALLRU|nr:hypothetical protein [Allomuricauda ruestringensis]AEM71042.1 hypothetical protein Murru_2003 [Allomuricauda ruestringensis DSM 13258]